MTEDDFTYDHFSVEHCAVEFIISAHLPQFEGMHKQPSMHSLVNVGKETMNVRKQKRSVSVPIIRPLACAFGLNETVVSSGSERHERGFSRRKSNKSMVHIDVPRKLKKSLTKYDDDDQSLFKLRKPVRRRRSRQEERAKASFGKNVSDCWLRLVSIQL